MSIQDLMKITAEANAEQEFTKKLKEKPFSVSQYRKYVMDSSLDSKQKSKLLTGDKYIEFRKKGFIVDDVPETLLEYKTRMKTEKPDHLTMPLSVWKQLDSQQMGIATSVKLNYFDDVGGGHQSKIIHYSDAYGLEKSYGKGNQPAGVRIERLDMSKPENVQKFKNAQDSYHKAMVQWRLLNNSIIKYRGDTLKKAFPLPEGAEVIK